MGLAPRLFWNVFIPIERIGHRLKIKIKRFMEI
jgi:hypothetical protein